MKSETRHKLSEKVGRLLLSLLCFVSLLFLFIAAIASSLNTDLNHFLLG